MLTYHLGDANSYFQAICREMPDLCIQVMPKGDDMSGDDQTSQGLLTTQGVHHLGLTVSRLAESAAFFTETLGWQEVRRVPEYPAIFVSDGSVLVTLWQTVEANLSQSFDYQHNVGLHHVAFRVSSRDALDAVFARVQASGAHIEFAPESLRGGPIVHMMCLEPSGIRVEFIWMPEQE